MTVLIFSTTSLFLDDLVSLNRYKRKISLLNTKVNFFSVIGDSTYKPDQTIQHFVTVHYQAIIIIIIINHSVFRVKTSINYGHFIPEWNAPRPQIVRYQ